MRTLHKSVLIAASLCLTFSAGLAATEKTADIYSSAHTQTTLSKINGFIDRSGGLDRVMEDAESGDADANYWLGVMHREGVVFNKDLEAAKSFFETSARSGHADGLFELSQSVSKESGHRAKHDSITILAESASLGNAEAQYQLSLLFLKGDGVDRSHTLGYFWLSKAVSNGFPEAIEKERELIETNPDLSMDFDGTYQRAITGHVPSLVKLSKFYENGVKVERDPAFAKKLLENAAMLGSEEAKAILSD